MNYYNEIKKELIDNEINKKVKDYSKNKYELQKYYNVGKMLSDAGKCYGEGVINEYSKKLTNDLGKGYTPTRLRYFRRFFVVFSNCPTLSDKLTYSHYCEIIWYEESKINYYIKISINDNLSVRELRNRIKNNEYERLPEETKNKLITNDCSDVKDLVKNPIIIKNSNNYENRTEKILQKLILEDIPSFLDELGNGFTFVKNEYKIKLGGSYNYIDLLLYNIKFRCYVVIELKVTKLKKEHIGQIETYINYIDTNMKEIDENKTIGIILVKENDKFIMEYCSDERIISKEYKIL